MSIKLMSQVWDSADVSGSELLVMLALADFANDEGGSIYPSMATIAKKARLSTDQTRRVVHKLIAAGLVELIEQGGWTGNRNRPNEYRIIVSAIGVLADCKRGTSTNARGGTRASASTVPAPVQDDPSVNHPNDPPVKRERAQTPTPPKQPTPQQEMFGAICEAVGWDYRVISDKNKGQVAQTAGILAKANYTVEDVRRFMVEIWFTGYFWTEKGSYPSLSQLREGIGKLRAGIPVEMPAKTSKSMDNWRRLAANEGVI